ncbi:MAG TPA: DUF4132 domain-containing protein, partial [Chitinophagales bacterium]|nr:DUF4132 domain-containing protein [Chitinophagales bacterium]
MVRNAFRSDEVKRFEGVIDKAFDEGSKQQGYYYYSNVSRLEVYKDVVAAWPDKERLAFAIHLVKAIHYYCENRRVVPYVIELEWKDNVRKSFLQQLFRAKLEMDGSDVQLLVHLFTEHRFSEYSNLTAWPVALMIQQVFAQHKPDKASEPLVAGLTRLNAALGAITNDSNSKERLKLIDKIDAFLFAAKDSESIRPILFQGYDEFAKYANEKILSSSNVHQAIWFKLVALARKATGSKPTNAFLKESKKPIEQLGSEIFNVTVLDWLRKFIATKETLHTHTYTSQNQTHTYTSHTFLDPLTLETLKGFVWMCVHFDDAETTATVAATGERAFRKIPNVGAAATAVGNACVYVLAQTKDLDGISHLSRLRLRLKQTSAQKLVDRYLKQIANERGVSVHEIEDLAVDNCGLVNGERTWTLDGFKAVLSVRSSNDVSLSWFKPDGTLQKAVPTVVKERYAAELKNIKATQKRVEATLSTQKERLDRSFRSERTMPWEHFRKNFVEHGLMSLVIQNVIWNFQTSDAMQTAIFRNAQWLDIDEQIITPPDGCVVSLWHPVNEPASVVKRWRDMIVEREIRQPFKQAFREVYLITEAELQTGRYSNRMAAHILKQHQFNSLAKTRGWGYQLRGSFDSGSEPMADVALPEYGLIAEFWLVETPDVDAMTGSGIWNYIGTDQVRFVSTATSGPVDLALVPRVVFSEVMRDVDLFVGVASVGNDPNWSDHGDQGARDYWQNYSFGVLTETAKTRKDVLERL